MSVDIPALMLEGFRQMPEEQQIEMVLLASNARFVLRMTENTTGDTLRIIRQALVRGIPALGGEPL